MHRLSVKKSFPYTSVSKQLQPFLVLGYERLFRNVLTLQRWAMLVPLILSAVIMWLSVCMKYRVAALDTRLLQQTSQWDTSNSSVFQGP